MKNWTKRIKMYYNSTVIRAGIYLLSAIMKNFVLNYERQLVDDCDNNAPPIQFFSFLNELLFLMGNSKKRKKNWRALGPKGTVQQFNSINFVDLDWICCCSCGGWNGLVWLGGASHPALSAEWKRWVMAAAPNKQTNHPQLSFSSINLFDWEEKWSQWSQLNEFMNEIERNWRD